MTQDPLPSQLQSRNLRAVEPTNASKSLTKVIDNQDKNYTVSKVQSFQTFERSERSKFRQLGLSKDFESTRYRRFIR